MGWIGAQTVVLTGDEREGQDWIAFNGCVFNTFSCKARCSLSSPIVVLHHLNGGRHMEQAFLALEVELGRWLLSISVIPKRRPSFGNITSASQSRTLVFIADSRPLPSARADT